MKSANSYKVATMLSNKEIVVDEQLFMDTSGLDVRIKIDYCGICGTDIALYKGIKKGKFPYTPGHEYTGVIVDVGDDVQNLNIGDRVTINPNFVCNDCFYCRVGKYNLCEKSDLRVATNGGMAEFVTVSSDFVYRLPDEINAEIGALVEPIACGIHALNLISRPSKFAVIKGAGTMGLIMLDLLRTAGIAEEIIVTEPVERKRKIAKSKGADLVLDIDQDILLKQIKGIRGVGADIVIDCSGDPQAIENVSKEVRKGGEILLLGRQPDSLYINVSPLEISKDEIIIRGTSRLMPSDIEDSIVWVSNNIKRVSAYLDKQYLLQNTQQAFEETANGDSVKNLIKCS